jgi:hypothetical protein
LLSRRIGDASEEGKTEERPRHVDGASQRSGH